MTNSTPTTGLLRKRTLNSPVGIFGIGATIILAVIVGYIIVSSHAATNGFVTRSGSQLMLGGSVFRFTGANLYWVGLDDNIRDGSGNPTYPTHYRIDDGFSAAVAMHASVARTHTVGISVGCSQCLMPASGQFNDAAFEPMDYAVKSAGAHGIKLQVPLIDQWRYYHGGKWNFVHWAAQSGTAGVTDTNPDMTQNAGNSSGSGSEKEREAQFYTNQAVIKNYQAYLSHLLNHVNQYTGIAIKDDPTIIDWETGNELFDAPTTWTSMMGTYLKTTIGVKQLVADGSAAAGNHVTNADLGDPNIDIVGGHFYAYPSGLDTNWMAGDAASAHASNKVYIAGEYAWTRAERPAFLSAVESNPNISGDMLWAILPHEENGTPEPHGSTNFGDDDVSLYYPTTSTQMQTAFTQLAQHGLVMNGTAPTPTPTATPTPVPTPTPLPTPAGSVMVNDVVNPAQPSYSYSGAWATSTGSAKYNGDDHYSTSGGDSANFVFTGTRAQIYGGKASHYGIASFSIDNGPARTIDLYSLNRTDQALLFDTNVLSAGNHVIKISNTGQKNTSSSSTVISIDAASYIPSSTTSPTPTPIPTNTPPPTPTPTPHVVSADVTGPAGTPDSHVNIYDLNFILSHWGTNYGPADITGPAGTQDGIISIYDLSYLLSHWTN